MTPVPVTFAKGPPAIEKGAVEPPVELFSGKDLLSLYNQHLGGLKMGAVPDLPKERHMGKEFLKYLKGNVMGKDLGGLTEEDYRYRMENKSLMYDTPEYDRAEISPMGGGAIRARVFRGEAKNIYTGGKRATKIHFSDSEDVASSYVRSYPPKIDEYDIVFKKPLVVDYRGGGFDSPMVIDGIKHHDIDAVAKYAKRQGYDGVVAKNIYDEGPVYTGSEKATTYIAFDKQSFKKMSD